MVTVSLRVYGGLNQHLEERFRQRTFRLPFVSAPSVDDLLALLALPVEQVGLVLVDGQPADRAARLPDGARVTVYPPLEQLGEPA